MKRTACLLSLLLLLALPGCIRHSWVEVESGQYSQVQASDLSSRLAAREIQSLYVDRDKATATITLADGSELVLAFTARERTEWPAGCPTNINHTYMEVLDIQEESLTFAAMTLANPVLVRNCPREPMQLVLREDGEIGGGGSARSEGCVIFER